MRGKQWYKEARPEQQRSLSSKKGGKEADLITMDQTEMNWAGRCRYVE